MATWIPTELRPILGRDLDTVDEGLLAGLFGLTESEVLDFKRELPSRSDAGKRELAADVAQLANGRGGLLIYGVDEDDGVAITLAPLDAADRDRRGLWVDQVTAASVSPLAVLHHREVEVEGGTVLLVAVPPSIAQPHAVIVNDSLRYPTRVGSGRRWLGEFEVAERYRRRFASIESRSQRRYELHQEIQDELPAADLGPDQTLMWTVMTAVPDNAGQIELRPGLAERWQPNVLTDLESFPSFVRTSTVSLRPRYRRLDLVSGFDGSDRTAQMHLDGSSSIAIAIPQKIFPMGEDGRPSDSDIDYYEGGVRSDFLVGDLINLVQTATNHAARCGAHGSLNVVVSLIVESSAVRTFRLVAAGNFSGDSLAIDRSVPVENPTSVFRALPLDLLGGGRVGLVEAARLLAADLMSRFGLAEPPQFKDNQMQANGFSNGDQDEIELWLKQPE